VFPHVVIDGSRELDTVVQLVNASDEPLEVRCLYHDLTPVCLGTGTCFTRGACDGVCASRAAKIPFRVRLTARQPLGWSVSRGLTELPLTEPTPPLEQSNLGTRVPALSDDPFQGTLRCVVVDDAGRPIDHNALAGSASIETDADAGAARVDAAQYNAIGLPAVAGANDGDEQLRLGGPQAEYAACPGSLVLPHLLDGALVRAGVVAGTVSTTIALVPCGGELLGTASAPRVVLQMFVHNEFGQRLSTSTPLDGQLVTQMSLIDTTQSDRSIFSAGVLGTLTGQTDVQAVGEHGILGVAVEALHTASDIDSRQHAAVQLAGEGAFDDVEILAMLNPPCVGDCDADGQVRVNELIVAINVALGAIATQTCLAIDADRGGTASIAELTRAVGAALSGCPARAPLPASSATVSAPTGAPPPGIPGAEVTFFGIASGDDAPQQPIGSDEQGRPIYTWPVGQGFSLVVEARPGRNRAPVGGQASAAELTLPDLQMLVSRPLGDGNPTVCDADRPNLGGVAAVESLEFGNAPDVVRAINDLGCRAEDIRGEPRGRAGSSACTRIPPANDPDFVSESPPSTIQFCLPIARAWAFPEGDTTVAVRVRDVSGLIGAAREIVIRIAEAP
jgi:hypothetical protein